MHWFNIASGYIHHIQRENQSTLESGIEWTAANTTDAFSCLKPAQADMKMGSFQGQTSTEDYATNNDKNNSTSSPTVTGKVTAISLLSYFIKLAVICVCQNMACTKSRLQMSKCPPLHMSHMVCTLFPWVLWPLKLWRTKYDSMRKKFRVITFSSN